MKIVVLAGGKSDEYDVSLSSGAMIANGLIRQGHQVLLMDLALGFSDTAGFAEAYDKHAQQIYTHQIESAFSKRETGEIGINVIEICREADITFLALHGGIGENGKLQALFDVYGIRYTGSEYQGSLLAMNKQISKELLRFHGFATADWQILGAEEDLTQVSLPAVVKPVDNGSSIGVTLVADFDSLQQAVKEAATFSRNGKALVEQQLIGREFSVGVLGEMVLPVIEIRPKQGFYDYTNKYQEGLTEELVPAPISPELTRRLQETAQQVHELLGLQVYSRTDFIVDQEGQPWVIEANSLPGMTPASLLPQESAANGIDYDELCETIVQLSLEKEK